MIIMLSERISNCNIFQHYSDMASILMAMYLVRIYVKLNVKHKLHFYHISKRLLFNVI